MMATEKRRISPIPLIIIAVLLSTLITLVVLVATNALDKSRTFVTTGGSIYPDLKTRKYNFDSEGTLEVAAGVIGRLSNWKVVDRDTYPNGIEVEVKSWGGLSTEKVMVIVEKPLTPASQNDYTVIDITSQDFGGYPIERDVNANNIRQLQAAMDDKLPQVK